MTDFEIQVRPGPLGEADAPGAMAIYARDLVLTRLQRSESAQPDDFAQVPLTRFGFWLADNWWRLRYEPRPEGVSPIEWRLAHDIGPLGGGFAWPRVTIWGEGDRVVLSSKADPPGIAGPVRFLTDAIVYIGAGSFETTVEATLAAIQQQAHGDDAGALRSVIGGLDAERQDPDMSAWRRMEAIAGFYCDEAPSDLMQALSRLTERYTTGDIEEAVAAHPGNHAAQTLQSILDASDPSNTEGANFAEAADFGKLPVPLTTWEPWQLAEQSAMRVRAAMSRPSGPLRNKQLAELIQTSPRTFDARNPSRSPFPDGLRVGSEAGSHQQLLLRTRRAAARRFEAARCLGDAIWSRSSSLGPIGSVRTARRSSKMPSQRACCALPLRWLLMSAKIRRTRISVPPGNIFMCRRRSSGRSWSTNTIWTVFVWMNPTEIFRTRNFWTWHRRVTRTDAPSTARYPAHTSPASKP